MRPLRLVFLFVVLAAPLIGAAGADISAGKKIYTNKCARCHDLYNPAKYTAADWDHWMEKMRKKSRLSDKDYDTLSSYLASLRQSP